MLVISEYASHQSWLFTGRTDAETPILWPPDEKSWLIIKAPNAAKDWRQKEKGMTEDEMASPTEWTWVWTNSRRQWRTGRPGVLQSMRSQRVGHNLGTEQQPVPIGGGLLLTVLSLWLAFLQGIFPTQGLNLHLLCLLLCKQILYHWATEEALM